MRKSHRNTYIISLSLVLTWTACSKEFLDVKPQKQQVVVETLQDVNALLDNAEVLNRTDYFRLISDGDLTFTENKLKSVSELQRNLYLWNKTIDPTGKNTSPWDLPYQQIMYVNVAMETLDAMNNYGNDRSLWQRLYSSALFYRAWAHYQLLQDFAPGFKNGSDQLGVPIIADSKYPKTIKRATLTECYDFIINDLTRAISELPLKTDIKTRPSKQAAHALLARIYQNLHQHDLALVEVNKALDIDHHVLDYNDLNFSAAFPFSMFNYHTNPEIIFFTNAGLSLVSLAGVQVADDLLSSYSEHDLRVKALFDRNKLYIGTYSGNSLYHFTGLATDELYLVKAESLMRTNRWKEGIDVLQVLLKKRYKNGLLPTFTPHDDQEALSLVLNERQKELVGRGTRWSDLKRQNLEAATQIDLTRTYLNETFLLPANSNRYVFEIPQTEIEISGIEQNIR